MQMDDFKKDRIRGIFKVVAQYREDAKASNQSASEAMKGLVEELTADKGEQKVLKKALNKAFKEYYDEIKGEPDSLPDMLDIVNVVCKGAEE